MVEGKMVQGRMAEAHNGGHLVKAPGKEYTVERHIVEWYRYCGRIHGEASLGGGYRVQGTPM
jgi:hypothetical protein